MITTRLVIVFCAWLGLGHCQRVDLTRVEESKGTDVVEAVVNILRRSCIFSDDFLYLRRVAYADTRDGENPFTYVIKYNGGIWHINETDLNKTRTDPSLQQYREKIQKTLYIDWTTVSYNDLRKPLYSAIATELLAILKTGNGNIPLTFDRQAELWSKDSARNPFDFLNAVVQMEKGFSLKQNLDIAFLLDSSASMSEADFNKSKEFVKNFISELKVDDGLARVAVVEYSTVVYSAITLDNSMAGSQLLQTVSNIKYRSGGTNTYDALQFVQDNIFTVNNGSRSNAAKVVFLVTDGRSGDNVATIKAGQSLRASGVTIFAVGVGSLIDIRELQLVVSEPSCAHLKTVGNYSSLPSDSHSSVQLAIKAPVKLQPGTYEFDCLSDITAVVMTTRTAHTITITTTDGSIDVFGSGSGSFVPNSAIFSFNETITTEVPVDIYVRDGSKIILKFQNPKSGGCQTKYRIRVSAGDHLQSGDHKICIEAGLVGRCNQKDIIDSPFIVKGTPDPTMPSVCGGSDVFTAPYPGQTDRYLLCSNGKLIVVYCLRNQRFDAALNLCVHNEPPTTTTTKSQAPTKPAVQSTTVRATTAPPPQPTTTHKPVDNPCTEKHIAAGLFLWPYPSDERKFIKCGIFAFSGTVFDCGEHKYFSQTVQTCLYKDVVASQYGPDGVTYDGAANPCIKNYQDDVQYHPYPGDRTKFIQCDAFGDAFVRTCRPNEVWEQKIFNCIPTGFKFDNPHIVG